MSRDVQDDRDEVEMRGRFGRLGCEKKFLVVVVMLEEEPLRSDTRLPLESSPYMAGNIFNTIKYQMAAGQSEFCSTQSPAIYLIPPNLWGTRIRILGIPMVISYVLPVLQVSVSKSMTGEPNE